MTPKQLMTWWNVTFPLDKWYREKYNLRFNSEEHRSVNPIDIYLEWVEDELHKELLEKAVQKREEQEQWDKGIVVKQRKIDKKKEEELFEKLKVSLRKIKVG